MSKAKKPSEAGTGTAEPSPAAVSTESSEPAKPVESAEPADRNKATRSPKPTKSGTSTSKLTKQAAPAGAENDAPADQTIADQKDPGTESELLAGPRGHEQGPEFLAEQRVLLLEVRASYTKQADELKAEADSLALEHEPGDVQFDEEGGEGGTSNVDRELDLVLSAQARGAVAEIDRALAKVDSGTYGACEQCGRPIPEARLQALPYAALCVACKSGGLSRR